MADVAPTRSRTDPPAPEDSRTERSLVPRRLHAGSFRSKAPWGSSNSHAPRHGVKDTVQSAVDLKPPINFEHLLRREKKPAEGNAKPQANAPPVPDPNAAEQLVQPEEKVIRSSDVAEAKRENLQREEELRKTLKSVEEVGMNSTRQLDETYYAILEKAAMLRSTVASLQQLAEESKKMRTSFQDDTKKLENDTTEDITSFKNFDEQEKNINDMVSNLQASRDKTKGLNERLEAARLRVEAYEERDNAKQAKRKTQFRITWAALSAVLVLVIAVLIARDRERVGDVVEQQLQRIGDLVEDVAAPVLLRPSPSEDPYLSKLFDL